MIECLSAPDWISPQIDFLIYLQHFRIGNLEHFDKLFLSVTTLGEYWIPTIVCSIIYWCIDVRTGIYLFSLAGSNIILAHLFKMIACVYRPWVLNSNLHPSELAIPYAKGYSFPSGHSTMSASVWGGLAYVLRHKVILCLLLILMILFIGFSRLWLGVHTPQDVLCGLLIGLVLVFAINGIINWAEKDKNRYLYLLGIINIFTILALIYIDKFNTYRIDYVNGELLVNPQKYIYVAFVVYGYSLGLINGCCLCRRFFPYNPQEASVKTRLVRAIVGIAAVFALLKYDVEYLFMNTTCLKIAIPAIFLAGLFITFIYPIIFTKFEKIFAKNKE